MTHESHQRIAKSFCAIGVLSSFAVLSGCVGVLSPIVGSIVYSSLKNDNLAVYSAQVLSARAPYKVTWTSKLGKAGKHKSYKAPLVTIASGSYRDWNWRVQGPQSVAASWQIWLQHGARQDAQSTAGGQPVILNWQLGFERLWKVTDYLLGEKPLPMQLTLTLIPNNHPFEAVVTKSNSDKVPVVVTAWYPTTTKISVSTTLKRFHFYVDSLALVGGHLERVELARGVTAAPLHGQGRIIKDGANAFCWNLAGRPSIAAGTNYKLKLAHLGSSIGSRGKAQMMNNMVKGIYRQHPKEMLAQGMYVTFLVTLPAHQYLSDQGLKFPSTGQDLTAINALLGFCRAFVHYPGDVRTSPMPLSDVKSAHFFPLPAAASAPGRLPVKPSVDNM